MTLTVTIPLPPRELSPNYTVGSRGARLGKAAKIRKYRQAAYLAGLAAINRRAAPKWVAATARATFYVRDRRRRDADNALASLKAAFDGLKDAGIVADDSGITHLPVVFVLDKQHPRVEITVHATACKEVT
jgi:Holliday junction resolvase RusA-like endonuclease